MTPDCTILVRSSAELLAYTPYLIGFHPTDSLVVIGQDGRQLVFGARYDLSGLPADSHELDDLARIVKAQSARIVTMIGYGERAEVTAAIRRFGPALRRAGVKIRDAILVTGGRWWSFMCSDPSCCPPEGQECPPPGNAIAAEAVFRGEVALPDRRALVAQVAGVTGQGRDRMITATASAERRLAALRGDEAVRGGAVGRSVRRAGRAAVREAERRHRAGRSLTDDEVAWLGLLLADPEVHDYAFYRSDDEEWRTRLWTDVLRRVSAAYVPGAASLLGFAAWMAGRGPLARVAIDRALLEEPEHRVACLLDRLLCSGIGPHAVAAFEPPGSPGSPGSLGSPGSAAGRRGPAWRSAGQARSGRPAGQAEGGPSTGNDGQRPGGRAQRPGHRSGRRTGGERRLLRGTRRRSL